MKTAHLIVALGAGLGLGACSDANVARVQSALSQGAYVIHGDIDEVVPNECAGEDVWLRGSFQESVRSDGTRFFYGLHVDGITGTGLSSGTTYRLNALGSERINIGDQGAATSTILNRAVLVGQGAAANSTMSFLMHVTTLPDGTTTATVDQVRVTCR